MRGLLELRGLFKVGSYMRKYGNYSLAVNNFLFFKSSHTFSLLIKTYELEIRNMTGTKYIVFTFDLPYDTEKLFLEFAPILCGGPVQFPARNHDIKMCVKEEIIQCLCMDLGGQQPKYTYLIFWLQFSVRTFTVYISRQTEISIQKPSRHHDL